MPAAPPQVIVQAILDAIADSGCSGVLVSSPRENPRQFAIRLPSGETINLWIHIWTLTPGGRASLPNEFRIQKTGVASPLPENPYGMTVLMGYLPDLDVFAGFDFERQKEFTEGSPSVQIDIDVLRRSVQSGLSLERKSNSEIAVGVRSDQFIDYIIHHREIHQYGALPLDFNLLTQAAAGGEVEQDELEPLPAQRQRLVRTVSRLSREANFREKVMRAYANRCAVTGIQLRLIDAAHILPVGVEGSSDDVRNGIALSSTYHRAFDSGLIFLDDQYRMMVNDRRLSDLRASNLGGGFEAFSSPLGRQILLPPDAQQRPLLQLIRRANEFRQIAR